MSEGIVRQKTIMPVPASGPSSAPEPEVFEYLGFMLADEQYALPLTSIREILKPPPVTHVPRAPQDILGVVSVRGRVTTVVDLRRRLRMPEGAMTKFSRVLLVDDGREVVGVLVDAVLAVVRLGPQELELAANVGGDTAEYVRGIGRPGARGAGRSARSDGRWTLKDDILILLDPRALLRR
ncbi:MAG: chemotaxis protein CheW [Deltaproteobacteria bacterium]|nr:MAG: chemotaxis protein CheW [Deltaproteobacteria bacterium]